MNATDLIKSEEGFRANLYKDSRGIPTIGYGETDPTRVARTTVDEPTAARWLRERIEELEKFLSRFSWYPQLSEVRRAVLVSMCYQLGEAGFMEFRHTIQHVAIGNFADAAREMVKSAWARQTPARAARAALMMRTNEWQ